MRPKQKAFLAAYAACGNIAQAARLAKIHRSDHFRWVKQSEKYAQAFTEAQDEAVEQLEAEARRRAFAGIRKPVIYKGELCYRRAYNPATCKVENVGGPLVLREYSDVLLIFLLKGMRPEKYRDNVNLSGQMSVDIGARLAAGRARLAKEKEQL